MNSVIIDKIVSGKRISRSTGNVGDYAWLKNQLKQEGYSDTLPEGVKYFEEFGIVKEKFGNWYIQKYLTAFEQAVVIGIPNGIISEHIKKWFGALTNNAKCIQRVLVEKIKHEYEDCFEGAKNLWTAEEIKESFPVLNNNEDVLNVISDIHLDIYDEETSTKHLKNHIYSIRASCPWDIEHGIEVEIKIEEINGCD